MDNDKKDNMVTMKNVRIKDARIRKLTTLWAFFIKRVSFNE